MDGENKRPVLKSAEELKGKKALSKKRRPKWSLLLALAVLAAGCWAVVNRTTLLQAPAQEAAPVAESTRTTLIDREASELQRITVSGADIERYTIVDQIEYDAEGAEIEKPEGEPDYIVEGDPNFALNAQLVSRMAQGASLVTAQSTIAEHAEDLSIYGLQEPRLIVEIDYRDGTKSVLQFGDQLPTGSNRYLRMDGQDTVYTASSTAFGDFNKQLNALHVVALPFTLNPDAVQRLLIEQTGAPTIELELSAEQNTLSLSNLKLRQPYDIEAHVTRGSELIQAVTAIALQAYAGHAGTPEELAAYGLAEPRARITYAQQDAGELKIAVGAEAGDGNAYVAIDETGDVYTVKTELLAFLSDATPARLVDQFAGLVNIQLVDSLIVEGNGLRAELGIARAPVQNDDGAEGTEESYTFNGAAVEEKPFKALYQEIIGLVFDKLREDESHEPGAPLATVRFVLNDGRPDIVIEYLEYDGDFCLIRNGERELFLIKRQKVQGMLDACSQFGS